MRRFFPRRGQQAQSIIETLVGIILLVPIALFLLDIAVLVLANTANDTLAKNCARAAASATRADGTPDGNAALTAAINVSNNFQESLIITRPDNNGIPGTFIRYFDWNGTAPFRRGNKPPDTADAVAGQVVVVTAMRVQPLAEFRFLGVVARDYLARALEPVVSVAP